MAAGQTVLTYNGVRIRNCHTRKFDEQAVYDESGSDLLYHKFTVGVIGYVYGGARTSESALVTEPDPQLGSAAFHHIHVRHALLQARGNFEMALGANSAGVAGKVLLRAFPAIRATQDLSHIDVNNGPHPKHLVITSFAADELLKVEYEIEVCVLQCDSNGSASSNNSGVLSNRWSVRDEIDANFYTTRTWTGRLRAATSIRNPNEFRKFVLPPLQDGMQRQSMSYLVTSDGLNLDYTIVDKEVAWSAPEPATYWRFSHTESYGADALTQFGDVSISLGGDRNVDKKLLIAHAASILNSVLLKSQGGVFQNQLHRRLVSLTITDTYGNDQTNGIHLYARVERIADGPEGDIEQRITQSLAQLGKPIDHNVLDNYNNNLSRGGRPNDVLETHGPVPMVSAFHTYLQTSCSPIHGFNGTDFSEDSGSTGNVPTPSMEAREVPELPEESPGYISEDHRAATYQYWRLDSEYSQSSMKVQLPLAGGNEESGDSQFEDTSVVVTLGRGLARRTIKVAGERMGEWPKLPDAKDHTDSNGIKYTLLNRYDFPQAPKRGPDGALIYSVRAEYEFAMSRGPRAGESLAVGSNPWENAGVHVMGPEAFLGEPLVVG